MGQATRPSVLTAACLSNHSSSLIFSPVFPHYQETLATFCLLCLGCCQPKNTTYSPRPLQNVASFKPLTSCLLSLSPVPSLCPIITFCLDCGVLWLYCIKFAYLEPLLVFSSTHSANRGPGTWAWGEYLWDGCAMGQAVCVHLRLAVSLFVLSPEQKWVLVKCFQVNAGWVGRAWYIQGIRSPAGLDPGRISGEE